MNTEDPKLEAAEHIKRLKGMSDEQHSQLEKNQIERENRAFKGFSRGFKNGLCMVCGHRLESFKANSPCIHWLLLPVGFKKKAHLSLVANRYSLMRVQQYLRWVANQDSHAKNINDIDQGDDLIKETIKWKNIEWSLSCKISDLEGHGKREPHYHIQIKKDGRILVKFNEFHLPLAHEDLVQFEAIRSPDSGPWKGHLFGEGMREVMSIDHNHIITDMIHPAEPDNAMLSVDTIVMAKPGSTLTVGMLLKMAQDANASGESIASASRRLENVAVESTISLGPGVVKETPRTGGRKNRKNRRTEKEES